MLGVWTCWMRRALWLVNGDWMIAVGDGRWKVGWDAIIVVGWRGWMSYGAWIYDVGGWLWKEGGGGWEREGLHS